MTSTAIFSAATAINLPPSTVKNRVMSPLLCACASDRSLTLRSVNNKKRSNLLPCIKAAAASDSTAIVDGPTLASTSEEEEIPAKIGARVRVKVPLKVYHVPKVPEVELNGKEGKVKEYVAVWKGKHISATSPYKIEFFEKLEGRGDKPVKFFVHLKEEEFEYID
ncbi:ferredoxin-thioredoxin reductase, variable chain-like [Cynara cardunculus var. scolymus]|uniref:ferredoxin-thioredoxin reductase, variable chain-like n=1 Tax=Cynara cardunculus var. scolymus TaxID=59895 RepID=UPI000D625C35|nr:ferredoxin-thioredoxin reductase, variable chain-like [Cynara cardunculus var. scolymus]